MHTLSSKVLLLLLPNNIIIEILLRLPAKTVNQFRYVCKNWFSLISEPEFIKKHLQRHSSITHDHGRNNNPSSLFIIARSKERSNINVSIYSADYNFIDDDDASRVVEIMNVPPPIKSAAAGSTGLLCLGSCNGLLGFCSQTTKKKKNKDVICLWNPCTEEYKEIIPPKQPNKLYSYDTTTRSRTAWKMERTTYGFGYDPIMIEYKVLANTCYVSSVTTDDDSAPGGRGVFHYKIVANVYTLGTNYSWRNIGEFPYRIFENIHGVLAGGALYWRAFNSVSSLDKIICFNLSDEEYTEIPIPWCASNIRRSRPLIQYMREFKGRLSIYRDFQYFDEVSEVWVLKTDSMNQLLKEEGGVSFWSNLFTISDYRLVLECRYKESTWLEPGICKDDGFLLMVRKWKDLYWYNPTDDSKTRRILADTHGEFGDMDFTSLLTYTESLASLNSRNAPRLTGHKEENEQQQQQGIRVQNGKSKTRRFLARLLPRCYGC